MSKQTFNHVRRNEVRYAATRGGKRLRRGLAALGRLLFLAVLVGGGGAVAQEALRASLAGQYAMEAKKRQIASGWGNVDLGPVKLDLSSQLSVSASDNVLYREDDREADLIVRPAFTVRAFVPVSDRNRLTFGAGIGYNLYLINTDLSYLDLTPDTNIGYDIYVGDFVINLHDRFYYTSDVATQPSLSGRASYGRFQNSLGVLTTWDLNQMVVSLNYDHILYQTTEDYTSYLNRTSDLLSLRAGWMLTPTTPLGLELGFGPTQYDEDFLDDLMQYSVGVFYEVPSGKFSSLRLGAGYVVYDPISHVNTNTAGSTMEAIYADLEWRHRITQHISYTLTAGNQMMPGDYSQSMELLYARLGVEWNIMRGYGLYSYLVYEDGKEGWVTSVEHFQRYSLGLGISKRLGEKLSASAGYSFLDRTSDFPGRNYVENRLVLTASYRF